MKNLWFIFIGLLIVFSLFFINYIDWNFDSLTKSSTPEKVKVPNSTKTTTKETSPDTSTDTHNLHQLTQKHIDKETMPEDEQIYKEEISETIHEEIKIKSIQKPLIKTMILNIDGLLK